MMAQTSDRTDLLRTFLSDSDIPCPGCGYNLRGLTMAVCPECNEALSLRLTLAEPRLGALIAAVAGLAAGAGAASIALFVLTATWAMNGFGSMLGARGLAGAFGSGVLLLGGALVMLARPRGRAWFRKGSEARARGLVLGCWAATAGWLAVVFAMIR